MDREEPLKCRGCSDPETLVEWRTILNGYYCEDCYQSYWDHVADSIRDNELTQ